MSDTIKRAKRTENFTVVRNEYLHDVNLSWKAKGLITYIMSLPPDWQLNLTDLKKRSKDGRDATAAGLRELIDNGYCQRSKMRSDGGTFLRCEYEVSDIKEFEPEPQTENPDLDAPQTENPDAVNPETVKPISENPEQINTNSSKDENKPNKQCNNTFNGVVGVLFSENEIDVNDKKKTTLFRNSGVFKLVKLEYDDDGNDISDYSKFESLFKSPEFKAVDLPYYYKTVADWSDTKIGIKRTFNGWVATVRNFIRMDAERGKLYLKPEYQAQQNKLNVSGAMEFLNDYD